MLVIITKKGMIKKLNENLIREMGRDARGVRALCLKQDDEVVSLVHIPIERDNLSHSQEIKPMEEKGEE